MIKNSSYIYNLVDDPLSVFPIYLLGVARILGQRPKRLEFQDECPGMSHNHRYSLACPNITLSLPRNLKLSAL
jgi:hypothetical protein